MAMFSESFLVRVADDRKLLGAPVLGQRRKAEGRSFNRPPDSRQRICGSVFVACHVLTSNRDLRSRAMLHLREIPPVRASHRSRAKDSGLTLGRVLQKKSRHRVLELPTFGQRLARSM